QLSGVEAGAYSAIRLAVRQHTDTVYQGDDAGSAQPEVVRASGELVRAGGRVPLEDVSGGVILQAGVERRTAIRSRVLRHSKGDPGNRKGPGRRRTIVRCDGVLEVPVTGAAAAAGNGYKAVVANSRPGASVCGCHTDAARSAISGKVLAGLTETERAAAP